MPPRKVTVAARKKSAGKSASIAGKPARARMMRGAGVFRRGRDPIQLQSKRAIKFQRVMKSAATKLQAAARGRRGRDTVSARRSEVVASRSAYDNYLGSHQVVNTQNFLQT